MPRNLLNRSFEVLGVDQKIWVSIETGGFGKSATGGTLPIGTNAIEHIKSDITFNIPREDSAARSGRSVVTRLSGKKEVGVSFESYIIPGTPDAGGKPTLPPIHPLILSAFGNVDTTDPDHIVYKLSRLNANSFRLLEEATHYARLATGCVAESITFNLPGDGKAQVSCEGFGQDVMVAGEATVAVIPTAPTGGAPTLLAVDEGKADLFEVGAYIDVISKDDGNTTRGVGLEIVQITNDGTNDIIHVDGDVTGAVVGDIVVGHAPDAYLPLSSQNALLGLKGSVDFAGYQEGECEIISAEISLTNNYTKKDFLYGTSAICGYIPDKRRSVGVKVEMLLNRDNFAFFMRNKKFVAENLTIRLEPQDIPAPSFPSGSGRTFIFRMPRVEFNIPPIEQPADGYVTLSLEGVAMATDIEHLDSELTLTIE